MLQDREKSAKTLSPLSAFKAFADHDKKAITNISVITVLFPWYSSAHGGTYISLEWIRIKKDV